MEPDVIRMYSSSPPPMEDEDEDEEFSDFTGVPTSASFSEFDTPTTFDQSQALNATSPPELLSNGRIMGLPPPQPAGSTKSNGVGQNGTPNGRTVSVEELKKLNEHQDHVTPLGSRTDAVDCNGTGEVLTNGFVALNQDGSPPTPHKVNDADANPDDFADFSAFSKPDRDQPSNSDWGHSNQNDVSASTEERGASIATDSNITGFGFLLENSEGLSNGNWGFHEESDLDPEAENTTEAASTAHTLAINGVDDNRVLADSNGERCSAEQSDEKSSENETEETETETSFGRPLSTDALEEFGDFSTTGSVPSPPLQEETATPADHSQLGEDDDEDFGDFGDFGEANVTGFADFDQQGAVTQDSHLESATVPPLNEDVANVDASQEPSETNALGDEAATFADFPESDSFADFSSAQEGGDNGGWQAFSEPEQSRDEGESWAAFGQEQDAAFTEKTEDESQPVTAPPAGVEEQRVCTTTALFRRLEKIFQDSFELVLAPQVEEEVTRLDTFFKPPDTLQPEDGGGDRGTMDRALRDVWHQLRDVNNAFGLRYQWGGSHTNKSLLCSLGIDTRNILFTGHKKQPVIVPMYAASLGMLEPTKEPVKPVSAAEMIASIAQSPSVSAELTSCPPDATQESLPPVQFDWSSSGLTNPLDASGGSSLLNLDFFGPVDESPSGATTSIPGVDPELYELTQAKLDVSGSSGRVVDAFARLMSTVEKTSTSTSRKPVQREENLSEEARRVIAGLPDLSFMQAKVLMFPSTLTPLVPSSSPD